MNNLSGDKWFKHGLIKQHARNLFKGTVRKNKIHKSSFNINLSNLVIILVKNIYYRNLNILTENNIA